MKIVTDLSNDLLNEVMMKMNPREATRLMAVSKDVYDSVRYSEKEALFWLKLRGPRAFIPYMEHFTRKMEPGETYTAKLLIQSYPKPEVLVFYAFKKNSLNSMVFLEQILGRDIIQEKLLVLKKQADLYPFKYRNLNARFQQFGYDNLTVEPLSERFKKLKIILSGIQVPYYQSVKHRILVSTKPNIADINFLMTVSPRVSLELLECLAEFGADVNLAMKRSTKDPRKLQCLIENGADVISYRDNDGLSTLHWAASNGGLESVKLLLNYGADPNAISYHGTPLHFAAINGHTKVVKLLIDHGVYVDELDYRKWTPLHAAAFRGHRKVVELLLDHGANIYLIDNNNHTPLHLAAKHRGIVELLLKQAKKMPIAERY